MRYLLLLILLVLLLIRVIFFYESQPEYPDGTKIRLTQKVTSEPIKYSYSQYLKLSGFKIYLPHYPEIRYGDEVVVEGIIQSDKLESPRLVKIVESKSVLYIFRNKLLGIYKKSLPQPDASLVAGVTIGSKSDLGTNFWEALKTTGTAHVVVASGMNITLIAKFLIAIFVLILPRKRALILALIGVWIYAMIAGFDAPIIRAAVMGSIAFTAQEIGRLYYAWRALILTAIVMILIKPEWTGDLGFWLSFAATLSLMLFESYVRKRLKFVPSIIREDLSTSLAAQVGVVPILFLGFGQINILAPFINALILWTIVPMTIIGLIGGILALIYEPFGTAVLWLTYPLTSWFVLVVTNLS